MSNDLKIADLLLEKILFHFRMMNTFLAPNVANHEYEEYYLYKNNGGYFPGNSVRIRLPNMFDVQRGFSVTPQPLVEDFITLQIQNPISIPLQFNSDEATTKINLEGEIWAERVMKDASHRVMAEFNQVVSDAGEQYVYNWTGDASTEITSLQPIYAARSILSELGAQVGAMYEGYTALSPQVHQSLTPEIFNLFLPQKNEELYEQGTLGHINGFDVFIEPQINTHRAYDGTFGTPAVRVASVSGDTVVKMKDLTPSITGIIKKGDLFTVSGAGHTKLNPVTKKDTGRQFQFVAIADADSDISGFADVQINPVLVSDPTNPRRNISGNLVVDQTITFVGDYVSNLVWLRPALTIVAPPLKLLTAGALSTMKTDPDTKIAVRYSEQDNVMLSAHGTRIDVWPGVWFDGRMACKIISKAPVLA